MSYTPTEWETGQTITAEKPNKLEQGVADAGDIVIITSHYEGEDDEYSVLDATWSELKSAMDSGKLVILKGAWDDTVSFGVLLRCNDDHSASDVQYAATFLTVFTEPVVTKFLATTKEGYPMASDD